MTGFGFRDPSHRHTTKGTGHPSHRLGPGATNQPAPNTQAQTGKTSCKLNDSANNIPMKSSPCEFHGTSPGGNRQQTNFKGDVPKSYLRTNRTGNTR